MVFKKEMTVAEKEGPCASMSSSALSASAEILTTILSKDSSNQALLSLACLESSIINGIRTRGPEKRF